MARGAMFMPVFIHDYLLRRLSAAYCLAFHAVKIRRRDTLIAWREDIPASYSALICLRQYTYTDGEDSHAKMLPLYALRCRY